jgi:hypothetical protein
MKPRSVKARPSLFSMLNRQPLSAIIQMFQSMPAPPLMAEASARYLGLPFQAEELLKWDVFDAVLTPGDLMLLSSWKTAHHARAFENTVQMPSDGRFPSCASDTQLRHVRSARGAAVLS